MTKLPEARLSGVLLDPASRDLILHFSHGPDVAPTLLRLSLERAHVVLGELGNWCDIAETMDESDGPDATNPEGDVP